MNMQALLKQAQKMQKELSSLEDEVNNTLYEESMGGGVIKVVVKGTMEIESISIDPTLLNVDGKEDLEEMIKESINLAIAKAIKDKEEKTNSITGGMKMPGGF